MERIKRIFSSCLLALVALLLAQGISSCSSKEDKLDKAITELNSMLPMKLGGGFTMEKVSNNPDGLLFEIKCNESEIDMSMLEQNKEELRSGSVAQLKSEKKRSKDFANLLQYCQDEHKSITYRYKGMPSGKTVDIVIPAGEI